MLMMNNGSKWQIVCQWRTIYNKLIMSIKVFKNIVFYNSPANGWRIETA